MKRIFIFALVAVCAATEAFAWGGKGHDVVAYVAECHLSRRAAKRITKILDGHSPVYYANWMDNASHTPEYAHTSTWHYANVDEGYTYETMPRNEKGDVVTALNDIVSRLRRGGLTHEEENTALRMLIHLMGDLHCPGHVRYGGGKLKSYPVYFNGRKYNYHTVWDDVILESCHRWSYLEYGHQLDRCTRREIRAICRGTVRDWFRENALASRHIY